MDADQLLQAAGVAMGLPDLRFDERRCARLVFDGKLAIDLEHDADERTLQAYSAVAPLPTEAREAVYAMLLQGNLFGAQTAGAALAIDLSTHEIVLCRTIALDEVSAGSFVAALEGLVNAAEHWQRRLSNSAHAVAPIPVADPSMHGFLRG